MMKVLFDLLITHAKHGAAEYTRRVFWALYSRIQKEKADVCIYCLYNSSSMPQYGDLLPERWNDKHVQFVDINEGIDKLNGLNCDVFFEGCAQIGGQYSELQYLNCRSVIVFHDCVWEELYNNDLNIYMMLNGEDAFRYRETEPRGKRIYFELKSPTIRFCRWLLYARQHGKLESGYEMLQSSLNLLKRRDDNILITVSEYSKRSLMYNFDIKEERIAVKYSPERVFDECVEDCKDESLKSLIAKGKKYYLLVSAGRVTKNAKKTLAAFRHYVGISPDSIIVTIGYGRNMYENHVDLSFLDDSDLQIVYANCYALIYPSYFEGFGYPPLEAMKYAKPVLSSNVCSMPEVLGDAPIYFSPIYESAIYGALCCLTNENYQYYSEKSRQQYSQVRTKQEGDLEDLINIVLK